MTSTFTRYENRSYLSLSNMQMYTRPSDECTDIITIRPMDTIDYIQQRIAFILDSDQKHTRLRIYFNGHDITAPGLFINAHAAQLQNGISLRAFYWKLHDYFPMEMFGGVLKSGIW